MNPVKLNGGDYINIDESGGFCPVDYCFYSFYTRRLWWDVEDLIIKKKKLNVNIRIHIFEIMLYFESYGLFMKFNFVI